MDKLKKKKTRKHKGKDDDYVGGQAHKHCRLNLWTEEAMAAAISEYNTLCGQLGPGDVSINSVAKRYNIPTTTFWKRYKNKTDTFLFCVTCSLV